MSRIGLIACLIAACSGGDCSVDPTPTFSYRPGAAMTDAGRQPVATETFDLQAGDTHACALVGASFFGEAFSRPRCWGGNGLRQLSRRGSPDAGEGWWYDGFKGKAAFAVGAAHACVTSEDFEVDEGDPPEPGDGPIRCWGNNGAGQLGVPADAEVVGLQGPTLLQGVGEFTELALGALHGCFTDGPDIFCWGDNRAGQRGVDGDCCGIGAGLEPPDDWEEGWRHLVAGALHNCAVNEVGRMACWGDDAFGQLGDGATASSAVGMVAVPDPSGDGFVDIAAGPHHTCAIVVGGGVYCWGRNATGELGTGDRDDRDAPVAVTLPEPVERIFAGGQSGLTIEDGIITFTPGAAHTCALGLEGQAYCWGANAAGQLGTDEDPVLRPMAVHPTLRFGILALGGAFTCGVLRDSPEVWCWGNNDQGQLGRAGDGTPEPAPADVLFEDDGVPLL